MYLLVLEEEQDLQEPVLDEEEKDGDSLEEHQEMVVFV
jgi:hypothetical protein